MLHVSPVTHFTGHPPLYAVSAAVKVPEGLMIRLQEVWSQIEYEGVSKNFFLQLLFGKLWGGNLFFFNRSVHSSPTKY